MAGPANAATETTRDLMIHETRARLLETIQHTIGRPVQTHGSKPFDVLKSEPGPPNFYQWKFSPSYPQFPKSSVYRWNKQDLEKCSTALVEGHLTVLRTRNTPRRSDADRHEANLPGNTPSHESLLEEILTMHQRATQLGHLHRGELAAAQAHLRALEQRIQQLEARGQADAVRIAGMEKQRANERSFDAKYLCDKIALAKREGEAAGRDNAVEEWHEAKFRMETELRRLRLDIRQERERARGEGAEEGLRDGLDGRPLGRATRAVGKMPSRASTCVPDGSATTFMPSPLESRRDRPGELRPEKQNARTLATTDDLSMTDASRKARRIIREHWGGFPDQVLPDYLHPRGYRLSDTTLLTLATFSRATDVKTAIRLLRRANFSRKKDQNLGSSVAELTTGDIQNARRAWEGVLSNPMSDHAVTSMNESPPRIRTRRSDAFESSARPVRQAEQTPAHDLSGTAPYVIIQPHEHVRPRRYSKSREPTAGTAARLLNHQLTSSEQASNKLGQPYMGGLQSTAHISLPSSLVYFSSDFVRERIGGNEMAFATVSREKQEQQCVPWPTVLKANPEHHAWAPRLGEHGAITFVSGRDHCGVLGHTYPVMLRADKDRFAYIGHYKLASRETVPVETWKAWPDEQRVKIAQDVHDKDWGARLREDRRIELFGAYDTSVADILELFESETEPSLRMAWTILELVHFNMGDYDALVKAWRSFSSKAVEPTTARNVGKRPAVDVVDAAELRGKRPKLGRKPTPIIDLSSDSDSDSDSDCISHTASKSAFSPNCSAPNPAAADGQDRGGPGPQTLASREKHAGGAPAKELLSPPPSAIKANKRTAPQQFIRDKSIPTPSKPRLDSPSRNQARSRPGQQHGRRPRSAQGAGTHTEQQEVLQTEKPTSAQEEPHLTPQAEKLRCEMAARKKLAAESVRRRDEKNSALQELKLSSWSLTPWRPKPLKNPRRDVSGGVSVHCL